MTEQYQCQSYSDDDRNVQDCTCGKCVETPDTEWEKEIRFNPRAMGKKILSDKMIVEEVRKGDNYVVWKSPKTTVHIIPDSKLREMLTSRDTYLKERVRERILSNAYPIGMKNPIEVVDVKDIISETQ